MSIEYTHPSWCVGQEDEGRDHVSHTLHASDKDDIIDIRLRLAQPAEMDLPCLVDITFVDEEEIVTRVVPLQQARMLADMLGKLLS